ncbi:MAG: energy-coupling factor transporter transmembrane component T [Candidatus Marinimicrobia bacterium]|nr:energy-coupling factor transporter transmembrane component T [Candidatus Neomarinimicrobiota bacterium]
MLISIISLILITFLSTLIYQIVALVFILFFVLLSDFRKNIFNSFKRFSILIIFTLLIHLFFRFENNYLAEFTQFQLWEKSLFYTFRNTNIILLMLWTINSITTMDYYKFLNSLQKKFMKIKINLSFLIQPLIIGLRYFDIIQTEFQSLQQIHRILGIKKPTNIIQKIRYYSGLILPLIINSIERAEILSIALTSRRYNYE